MDLAQKELHIVGAPSRRYGNLVIRRRGRTQTLDACLIQEEALVREFSCLSQVIEEKLHTAHGIVDNLSPKLQVVKEGAVMDHIASEEYDNVLGSLGHILLGGATAKHSPQAQKLMKLGLDYLIRSHRRFTRKSGIPYAVHPFMTACLVAEEGADFPTVIAAMLHDRIEESVASYVKRLKARGSARRRAIDDRASGILYSAGLYFYEQARRFTFSQRYFEDINSLLTIVDKLSRTRNHTYYEYLERLFYPKVPKRAHRAEAVVWLP